MLGQCALWHCKLAVTHLLHHYTHTVHATMRLTVRVVLFDLRTNGAVFCSPATVYLLMPVTANVFLPMQPHTKAELCWSM
jgi:hypothetical protein